MKVFFSEAMVADIGPHSSPSSIKPRFVAEALRKSGLAVSFVEPEPISTDMLNLAHDPQFVSNILSGRTSNGFGNKSPEVIRSLPYTSGSLFRASVAALLDGVACSLSSGFHHAGYASAGGYCTFNGLMVTALGLQKEGMVRRVAIVDCDQHYGDGTANIIRRLGLTTVQNWSFGEWYHSPKDAMDYLQKLRFLELEFTRSRPDIILYQAGADVHIDDPLGGVLSTEQMKERDTIVFELAHRLGIPIVWNLAGGYQRDANGGISKVIDLHVTTARVACEVFSKAVAVSSEKILRKTYRVENWSHWDRVIHEAVQDFKQSTNRLPNILLAANETFRRIDIAANVHQENIFKEGDHHQPADVPFVELSGFKGDGYDLDMCIEDSIPRDSFALLYDSDPEGGLPLPEEDNVEGVGVEAIRVGARF